MALNIGAVRTGIKTALTGLVSSVYDYDALRPTIPAAIVRGPIELDPRPFLTATGSDYQIPVVLLVGGDEAGADDILEALIQDVLTALRVDRTLGGACDSCDVSLIRDWGWQELGDGLLALGVTVVIDVMT